MQNLARLSYAEAHPIFYKYNKKRAFFKTLSSKTNQIVKMFSYFANEKSTFSLAITSFTLLIRSARCALNPAKAYPLFIFPLAA